MRFGTVSRLFEGGECKKSPSLAKLKIGITYLDLKARMSLEGIFMLVMSMSRAGMKLLPHVCATNSNAYVKKIHKALTHTHTTCS